MSLFFNHEVIPEGKDTGVASTAMSWCDVDSILAVAFTSKTIRFYQAGGEALPDVLTKSSSPTCLSWKPASKVLAVGWSDGIVSLWNHQERMSREDAFIHRNPITFLQWNSDGTRLVTGDDSGTIGVWKTDPRGRLISVCNYRKKGKFTHCIFVNLPDIPGLSEEDKKLKPPACCSFFFGGEAEAIYYADDMGHCMEVMHIGPSIGALLYYEEQSRIAVLTNSLSFAQLELAPDGKVVPIYKSKLSMNAPHGISSALWVAPGLMVTTCGEKMVRFFDLLHEGSYNLSIPTIKGEAPRNPDEAITHCSFNFQNRILSALTTSGVVLMWKFHSSHFDANGVRPVSDERNWEVLPSVQLSKPGSQIVWGPGERLLAVRTDQCISILNETVLHRKLEGSLAVIQVSSERLNIELDNGSMTFLEAGLRIGGMDVFETFIVVWNSSKVEVYEVEIETCQVLKVSNFTFQSKSIAIHKDSLFIATGNKIEVTNYQGVIKQTIPFTDAEGIPNYLSISGKFLAIATSEGLIKLMDVSRAKPKAIGSAGRFADPVTDKLIGFIRSIRCNLDGTRVSILCDTTSGSFSLRIPDTCIYVYNTEIDTVQKYDFGPVRYPVEHQWDCFDARLFAVETNKVVQKKDTTAAAAAAAVPAPSSDAGGATPSSETKTESKEEEKKTEDSSAAPSTTDGAVKPAVVAEPEVMISTLFVATEHGILVQDTIPLDKSYKTIMGIRVPRLYFVSNTDPGMSDGKAGRLRSKLMRDFVGLDKVDVETRDALLSFSYFLTVGDMDKAYRAVKLINNPVVWENMAHMCVKMKRIDVAEVCLGKMGHARGARAVRLAKTEPEIDVAVAMVAIQLGMLDDAVLLYENCGRFDLLNKFFQCSGNWRAALNVAKLKDRIHLKTTHYRYAKYLENIGETKGAIENYEASDCHRKEVPRMLYQLLGAGGRDLADLEEYINHQNDNALTKWWAQFCESKGKFEKAIKYYEKCSDVLSQCRIHCYNGDISKAKQLVSETGNTSAAYHVARVSESNREIKEAIFYFSKAGCNNHAIRLCKEIGADAELMSLALKSTSALMVSVARYFEQSNNLEKAVQLFQKGGQVGHALNLCYKFNLYDQLREIADNLGSDSSPEVLRRAAQFFTENNQFDKAVNLLINSGRHEEALILCMEQNVPITSEMADKMTPEKGDAGNEKEKLARNELLKKLAKCCKKQGNFKLATKKFTQAGEKELAMRCLIKTGETDKIIYFANISRKAEIFILAANYMQGLDWHNDSQILTTIIQFYTKAKALEKLAVFYEACAQVEIDEYRDYNKALGALKESFKFLSKARAEEKDDKIDRLQIRIEMVERFITAKNLSKKEPTDCIKMCMQLLESHQAQECIREGDILALLAECYLENKEVKKSYKVCQQMIERDIELSAFLDEGSIERIYGAVGMEVPRQSSHHHEENDDDDDIHDEVGDDIAEDEDINRSGEGKGADSDDDDDEVDTRRAHK